MTSIPAYRIGAAEASMASLESLGLPLPKAEAVDYATYIENGAGELVGQGWLRATWRFAALTLAQVATLEAFDGDCYIQTLTALGTYVDYSAMLVLPPRRAPKNQMILDYVAEFRKLVVVT